MTVTSRMSFPTTSNGRHPSSGTGAQDPATAKTAEATASEPTGPLVSHLADLQQHLKTYLQTWADESRVQLESALIRVVGAAVAAFLGGVALAVAAVLLLTGLADGLGALVGARWLGQVLVGLAVLVVAASGACFWAGRQRQATLRRLVDKYEGSRNDKPAKTNSEAA